MSKFQGITLLGLGPGDPMLLTRQAWAVLEEAAEITLRTRQHPVVAGFPAGLRVNSFDELYDQGETFEAVYQRIVDEVLALGQRPQGVVYGVPGHPFVAEATGPEIARLARERGIALRVIEGISFLEPVFSTLGIDPLPHTALVDALELAAAHVPPFPPDAPAIIAQIHSAAVAAEVKLTLSEVYPDEHPVQFIHAAGTGQAVLEELKLYEIDRSRHIGLLTTLYLPPLAPATSMEAFQEVIAHLRAPDGCPWDKEQTHQTLRNHLLEETYEVLAALDADDPAEMCEEFGDLLLQVVLHAQIASEYGEFTLADVLRGINTKIVRRHPHVFGDLELNDAEGVLQNWERLKAAERKGNDDVAKKGILDGVSLALPALVQAQTYQERAARVGFEWPDLEGVLDKIAEEIEEVRTAASPEERAAEIGDLFFALTNLARWNHVDAESQLRSANLRFRRRFSFIEKSVQEQGRAISDLSKQELLDLWAESKE